MNISEARRELGLRGGESEEVVGESARARLREVEARARQSYAPDFQARCTAELARIREAWKALNPNEEIPAPPVETAGAGEASVREKQRLLDSTKPLFDPVMVIGRYFLVAAVPGLIVDLFITIYGNISFGLLEFEGTLVSLMMGLLILPARPTTVFYLRAFRSDRQTVRIRQRLGAIMGPGERLSGIRPPSERLSSFVRFCLPGFFSIWYAGSKFMELEAGDDWLARLWKSYQLARLVFIDARDITENVHREVIMTTHAMGLGRCIFLVDDRQTPEQWRAALGQILGQDGLEEMRLLNVASERLPTRAFADEFKAMLSTIPRREKDARPQGREFILQHVSEDELRRSQKTPAATVAGAIFGVFALVAGISVLARIRPLAFLLIPICIAGLILFAKAYFGMIARQWSFVREGHRAWPALATIFLITLPGLASFCCGVAAIAIPILGFFPKVRKSDVEYQTHKISYALYSYANDHNGAYPAGTTSTAIFQQLLDQQYVSNPSVFYFPMTGKTTAATHTLTAQNVCFDVTGGLKSPLPAKAPVVFTTGFTVSYNPGDKATPDEKNPLGGLIVEYGDIRTEFLPSDRHGSVSGFVPDGANLSSVKCRQLKP